MPSTSKKRWIARIVLCGVLAGSALPAGAAGVPDEPAAPPLTTQESNAALPEETLVNQGAEEQTVPLENTALSSRQGSGTLCENVGDLLNVTEHNAYISGFKDGTFGPETKITRAQAAQMFYNLLLTKPAGENKFGDVPEKAWYTEAVQSMAALGAIDGYADSTFRPAKNITRAEFVALASRFCALREGHSSFRDVSETSWAGKYINSACANGWIDGYADGTFHPNNGITRGEAVKVINKMLGRTADKKAMSIYYTCEFPDVSRSHWAYLQIVEAATPHTYEKTGGVETWLLTNQYDGNGWEADGKELLYRDSSTGKPLYGFQNISGYTYYFDMESGNLLSGWQVIGGKNYYLPGRDQALTAPNIASLLTNTNYTAGNRSFGDIQYITVHYTAVPNDTAKGQCEYFKDSYRGTSAHYFVDDSDIYQCVQDKDIAWHCGNDVYYHDSCRNSNSIGIEMCSKKVLADHVNAADSDWYFDLGTESNSASLLRELMMKYGIPLENVVRHYDVSHKTCPAPYVNDFEDWQNFLLYVSGGESDYKGSYHAEVTAPEIYVRTGPGKEYGTVGTLKKGSRVTVVEESGAGEDSTRWMRIPGGWVSAPYLCRLGA